MAKRIKWSNVVALVKTKQAHIAKLEAQLASERSELNEIRAALSGRKNGTPTQVIESRRRGTKAGSSVAMTEAILKQAGKPLHVNDLIFQIEKQYGESVRYSTLVGNLARAVKAGKDFYRAGPNTFGLLEWQPKAEDGTPLF